MTQDTGKEGAALEKWTLETAEAFVSLHAHQEDAIRRDVDFDAPHAVRYEFAEARGFIAGHASQQSKAEALDETVKALEEIKEHERRKGLVKMDRETWSLAHNALAKLAKESTL